MTVRESAALGLTTPLFAAVEEINHRQREVFVDRITVAAGGLEGAHIALLGLTFKPDTDDLREAPALEIASALIERGATVVAYDPMPAARAKAAREVPGLVVVDRAMKAIVGADAIGLVTEWPEFARLPWGAIAKAVRRATIVDGRNALQPELLVAAGFDYVGFGREGHVAVPDAVPTAAEAPTATTDELQTPVGTRAGRGASIEAALSGRNIDRTVTSMSVETNASGA
jgi:UDPglucose 6-dehydrogenase